MDMAGDKMSHDGRMMPACMVDENDSSHRQGEKWIAGAIAHPGALTRKAKRAGESPMEFAREHAGASGTTGRQARLAITLSKMHKK